MESRKLIIAIFFLHSMGASGLLEFRPPGGANTELVEDDDSNGKGFSLELVHCDSVDSPLYPGNLTSAERMQRDTRLSESRRLWLESISATVAAGPQDLNIRPVLSNAAAMYTVKVVVGTVESHLLVDTGSGLVWVQSEPCNTCFEHDGPGYKPAQSRSYRMVPTSSPICKPPLFQRSPSGQCTYEFKYGFDGRYTRGALAFEKFSFESKNDPRSLATVDDVIFGASNDNSRNMFQNNRKLVGLLGMDMAEVSFPMQMARRDPRQLGRFSYCLVPESGASSHLRFGNDVIMQGVYQSTPFLRTASLYYLNLSDISINGEALRLPPDTFRRNPGSGSGGVLFDSGSPKTYFIQGAYDAITGALVRYFQRLGLRRVPTPDGRRLCYSMAGGRFDALPRMDFHFEGGATLRPDRSQVFYVDRERRQFCLFMAPSAVTTIIGAHVQRNVHFVYDVLGKQLLFAPKDCRAV